MKERCIVIPAIKKNAIIPDQLVKKLAGVALIERAIHTARAVLPPNDVITLTDSEEISLLCQRAGIRFSLNPALRFNTYDIVSEMRELLQGRGRDYVNCIILRPSCPLLTWVDIEKAWKKFRETDAASLVSVRTVRQRLWKGDGENLESILAAAGGEDAQKNYLVETRALIMLKLESLDSEHFRGGRAIPFFMDERGIEIQNYQDWWICERLLERRHVVFVVAGYPAIGLGHVYRALMLAHEISTHKVTFVCTRASDLAAENVASRDYRVIRQNEEPLAETVAGQQPDLIVNDLLNTDIAYMRELRKSGARCVNFEDQGAGAALADLVINALEDQTESTEHTRRGPSYFCLRDEFMEARRNPLRDQVYTLLISFGGTDQRNCTRRVLDIVEPICRAFGIAIRIVAGPGYAHKAELEKRLAELENPLISFTWATNVMSRMMEGADLAICSAGRTVYELAHMRVPGIVLATHAREVSHTFARWRNGFAFAGEMDKTEDGRIRNFFLAMLKQKRRARCWARQDRWTFAGNKARVIGLLQDQLEKSETWKEQ